MSDDLNELTRNVIQACAACKHGRARLVCNRTPSRCPNRKVKGWLKEIEQIQKKKETKQTWDTDHHSETKSGNTRKCSSM